ncbi:DELLA protein RGL2-like [Alnus glutinosa]|uniref:DELLA protein RGL2-like n=1 Tax=Alnus glutinosa TaxID=3517 RepID=UPI002D790EAB|nr:DELLA protein RGL2-like [Alnus glutinosa]
MEVEEANPISTVEYGGAHLLKDQPISNDVILDEFHFDSVFPPTELAQIPTRDPSSLASFELLRKYGNGFKKLKGEIILSDKSAHESTPAVSHRLSTEEIMRVAGARYVQFPTQMSDDYLMPGHPFGFALSAAGLSEDETRDVELAHLLLAAAEKVSYRQYDRASRLLLRCEWISSAKANPVQRVVFRFAEALQERIEKEIGRATGKGVFEPNIDEIFQGFIISSHLPFLTVYKQIPFTQILLFTGIQAIVEKIAFQRKIHLIDIGIRCGVQWTILMQALAERRDCPIELLKITAVGSTGIEETGKRLANVAESLNLPFSFKPVLLPDMNDVKDELFETEDDEYVIIFAPHILGTMISRPTCLENLMRVIRNLYPSIMVVIETEANHNSPSFLNRFIEALFFYSAYYDSFDTCLKQYDADRMRMETVFGDAIRNIVAEEGAERNIRNVTMDVWRAFFARYRMVEIGFSEAALSQASLVVKRFACRSSCTIDKNGKCVIVGWKGSPIHSLSLWKFR